MADEPAPDAPDEPTDEAADAPNPDHDATDGASSSTSVFRVSPRGRLVDSTCANTWNRPADPAAP